MDNYIFRSQRLGFRNWSIDDLEILTEINNDDQVMEFFPFKPSRKDTRDFIFRMQEMFDETGFCYFAVEVIETQTCIGFIGICEQTYFDDIDRFVDIGWRLHKNSWNKGYATEGAIACIDFAFNTLKLKTIYAVAPEINTKSEAIMKKIGMKFLKTFEHPKLLKYSALKNCVLYSISR
ncbi:GNAT family N-acetyltransferase [Aquimarina algicola]|uniref:GNAT family N-acetyltransferase n=1 Tax=Aquimarina algicola TaxID=2589995 RepID=A0A504J7M4_9FLAO|nr:GNAT family N-acetyltransferase [Aquimarina algicola]TPN82151.1 GNAT family N-acetyltransferase [Aquimarina algicola]